MVTVGADMFIFSLLSFSILLLNENYMLLSLIAIPHILHLLHHILHFLMIHQN